MKTIILIISILINILLIIKVIQQKREIDDLYEDDYPEDENNDSENLTGDSKKIDFIYTYFKKEKENLYDKIKGNNLDYQRSIEIKDESIKEANLKIKELEEKNKSLIDEIDSLKTENSKLIEETTKKRGRKKKTEESEKTKEIEEKSNDKTFSKNTEKQSDINEKENIITSIFSDSNEKELHSKLGKMNNQELLNYYTNVFDTLKDGNPKDSNVINTYENAIKDIKEYEEEKSFSTGLISSEGRLKIRALRNYIEQLEMTLNKN